MLCFIVTIAIFSEILMNSHVVSFSIRKISPGLSLKGRMMDQTTMALTGTYGALVTKNYCGSDNILSISDKNTELITRVTNSLFNKLCILIQELSRWMIGVRLRRKMMVVLSMSMTK